MIDDNKSIESARSVLKKYKMNYLICGENFEESITVRYTVEPKTRSNVYNPMIDEYLNRVIQAERYVKEVNNTLGKMNTYRRKILYYKFMVPEADYTNIEIADIVGSSIPKLKKDMRKALLEFAYGFQNGLLLVEK